MQIGIVDERKHRFPVPSSRSALLERIEARFIAPDVKKKYGYL
ncbi:hypothetical protein [Noviherbaspirillum aerium]|nr:hypothetical protein [Noviherbaspirillum aerium]